MKYLLIASILFISCQAEENLAPRNVFPVKVTTYANANIQFTVDNLVFNHEYKADNYQYKIINLPKGKVFYVVYFKDRVIHGAFDHDGNTSATLWQ